MTKAAAAKVGSSLVARKLMRELKAKPGMPVWRLDEDRRPISLMITKAGQKAIGVEDGDAVAKAGGEKNHDSPKKLAGRDLRSHTKRRAAQPDPVSTPRAGDTRRQLLKCSSLP